MAKSINLKFPLRKSPNGAFQANYTTIEAVKDDLRMLLLTNHGERPCLYDFGANLIQALFNEPGVNVNQQVADLIISAVAKWMPGVTIDDLQVSDSNSDLTVAPHKVKVKIQFSVGQIQGVLEQGI